MADSVQKVIQPKDLPKSYFLIYLCVGVLFNLFPVLLFLLPFFLMIPFHRFKSVILPPALLSSLKWRISLLHLVWIGTMIFMPLPFFIVAFGVGWHLCAWAFFLFYFESLHPRQETRRISGLITFSVICFIVLWSLVMVDAFVLQEHIRLSLVEGITTQAQGLRQVLMENKLSPYQLPAGVRLLLEKGPKEWSEVMVTELPAAIFGFLMIAFFFYWSLFDMRFVNDKLRIHRLFQVPDWTMGVIVFWLTMTLVGYFVSNLITQYDYEFSPAFANFLKEGGLFGFLATLWWYAFEGVSILARRKFAVRKFWIFFLLIGILLFNLPIAVIVLMGVGLIAQVRRFIPKKPAESA